MLTTRAPDAASGVAVDLWWADLRHADIALVGCLPPAERERVTALERPADRGRRLVAAALLQHAVGGGPVEVDRTCDRCGAQHGRPVVAGGPHVSVAHAGVIVVVATCREAMVGVDVERTARFDGSVDRTQAWARQEAALKAGVTGGLGALATPAAPLPGYAAALCVAADGLTWTEHSVSLAAGAPAEG